MRKTDVKVTKREGESRIISSDTFRALLLGWIGSLLEVKPDITESELREQLYPYVLQELKKNNYFYPGLTFTFIWDTYKDYLNKVKYQSKTKKQLEAEYDNICWNKVNGLSYSEEKFRSLKKIFNKD